MNVQQALYLEPIFFWFEVNSHLLISFWTLWHSMWTIAAGCALASMPPSHWLPHIYTSHVSRHFLLVTWSPRNASLTKHSSRQGVGASGFNVIRHRVFTRIGSRWPRGLPRSFNLVHLWRTETGNEHRDLPEVRELYGFDVLWSCLKCWFVTMYLDIMCFF